MIFHIFLKFNPDLRPGQRIIAIGNPLGLDRTVSDGIISAVRELPDRLQIIQITAPISSGSSGGPLLDEEGYVIGVTAAAMVDGQNLNFAIKPNTIERFLSQPNMQEPLKKAKSRVLWRSILKWVVAIVLGFLGLALGGFWWILPIIGIIFYIIFLILRGIYRFVRSLMPERQTSQPAILNYNQQVKMNEDYDEFPDNVIDYEDSHAEEADNRIKYFHCWKCGAMIEYDSLHDDEIICNGCGIHLQVPTEE